MKEFLFLSGQIRALESKLMKQPQIDRMIGAKDAAAAFRVLTELQYADYFDNATKPEQFVAIIDAGLKETKELIAKGSDHDKVFDFIWKEFDLNNLKRALKQKFIEKSDELSEFTETNGYSNLGDISREAWQNALYGGTSDRSIPTEYRAALEKSAEIFAETGQFQLVEFACDHAHMELLHRIADASESEFLSNYVAYLSDEANVKVLGRSLLEKKDFPKAAFIEFGNSPLSTLQSVDDVKSFLHLLKETRFLYVAEKIDPKVFANEPDVGLVQLERLLSKAKMDYLITAEEGEISSIQVPLVYFIRRVQNARMIKYIMFAKLYGISAEKIYEALPYF